MLKRNTETTNQTDLEKVLEDFMKNKGGTVTVPSLPSFPQTHPCPSCGHCPTCGRKIYADPYPRIEPIRPYFLGDPPYIGDPPWRQYTMC